MMRSKWKAFFKFSLPDRWLVSRLWVQLLLIDCGLRALPFRTLLHWAGKVKSGGDGCDPDHFAHLLETVARHHVYPMTCLRRGLALQRMLGSYGVTSHLRIGVRKEKGELRSHAWVELPDRTFGYANGLGCEFLTLQRAQKSTRDPEN